MSSIIKHNFKLSCVDTDSISFSKEDNSSFSKEEIQNLLDELNSILPEKVKMDFEDYFEKILVVRTKNYVLKSANTGKLTIKGSALKASNKEKKLQTFIKEAIDLLLEGDKDGVVKLYDRYIKEIMNISDITDWASKKTVTKSVLNPERTNEQRVLNAIEDEEGIQEGDKIWVYFDINGELKLRENWTNDHNPFKLMEKLWNTVKVFDSVIDKKLFMKYHLKTNRKHLEGNSLWNKVFLDAIKG